MGLSVAMIVKNEEKYLERCLKSLPAIVNEVVVVDTGSSDRTADIAVSNGAKLLAYEWDDDFSAARNFAINQTSGDWILVMDADEYFAEDCSSVLESFMNAGKQIGRFEIVSKYMDNGETAFARDYVSRLFPRGAAYAGRIHEQLIGNFPRRRIGGAVIHHDGYYQTDKHERNLSLLLLELQEKPGGSYVLFQLGRQYNSVRDYAIVEMYLTESYRLLNRTEGYAKTAVVELLEVYRINKKFREAFSLIDAESEYMNGVSDFHFGRAQLYLDYAIESADYSFIPEIEKAYKEALGAADEIVVGTASYRSYHNLGVFYELTGQPELAKRYYRQAAECNFGLSAERLEKMGI